MRVATFKERPGADAEGDVFPARRDTTIRDRLTLDRQDCMSGFISTEGLVPRLPHRETTRPREAKLFRNNKSLAVRIPADFELPGDRVMIYRDGPRLIIEPVRRRNLLELLATLEPLGPEDEFPDIDDTLLPAADVAL